MRRVVWSNKSAIIGKKRDDLKKKKIEEDSRNQKGFIC